MFESQSVEETIAFAAEFAEKLKPKDIVLLVGDLGSGKTHFTKGLAKGLGYESYHKVKSPTFTLVHEIPSRPPIFHFDLYRFSDSEELYEIGFEDYLSQDAICVLEWGNKFQDYLPRAYYEVHLQATSEKVREIKCIECE